MVVKRPKGIKAQYESKFDVSDEMVRKSLSINPGLRQGMDTDRYLERLREKVRTGGAPQHEAGNVFEQALVAFLQEKSDEVRAQRARIDDEMDRLQSQARALGEHAAHDVQLFLQQMWSQGLVAPNYEILKPYAAFFRSIGLSPDALLPGK
jgi:hypothetical protein